jgi:copper resistance protein B
MKIFSRKKIFHAYFQSLLLTLVLGGSSIPMTVVAKTIAAMKNSSIQESAIPAEARDPNVYANGYEYRGMAGWEETDEIVFSKVIFDQLEYRNNDEEHVFRWDTQSWRGTDYNKLWFKFEGEYGASSNSADLELQALYSRAIAAFWDFQLGIRYDLAISSDSTDDRLFAVLGFQGLAPHWFDLEPALFISEDGDVSARLTATYDLLFTQRLILQPRFELNVAASEVREFGVGKGVNDVQLGLRLRYEIRRELAPYMGLSWARQLGDTEDLARASGEGVNDLTVVAGLRLWF